MSTAALFALRSDLERMVLRAARGSTAVNTAARDPRFRSAMEAAGELGTISVELEGRGVLTRDGEPSAPDDTARLSVADLLALRRQAAAPVIVDDPGYAEQIRSGRSAVGRAVSAELGARGMLDADGYLALSPGAQARLSDEDLTELVREVAAEAEGDFADDQADIIARIEADLRRRGLASPLASGAEPFRDPEAVRTDILLDRRAALFPPSTEAAADELREVEDALRHRGAIDDAGDLVDSEASVRADYWENPSLVLDEGGAPSEAIREAVRDALPTPRIDAEATALALAQAYVRTAGRFSRADPSARLTEALLESGADGESLVARRQMERPEAAAMARRLLSLAYNHEAFRGRAEIYEAENLPGPGAAADAEIVFDPEGVSPEVVARATAAAAALDSDLVVPSADGPARLPSSVVVDDSYAWRRLALRVAREGFPVEYVVNGIDPAPGEDRMQWRASLHRANAGSPPEAAIRAAVAHAVGALPAPVRAAMPDLDGLAAGLQEAYDSQVVQNGLRPDQGDSWRRILLGGSLRVGLDPLIAEAARDAGQPPVSHSTMRAIQARFVNALPLDARMEIERPERNVVLSSLRTSLSKGAEERECDIVVRLVDRGATGKPTVKVVHGGVTGYEGFEVEGLARSYAADAARGGKDFSLAWNARAAGRYDGLVTPAREIRKMWHALDLAAISDVQWRGASPEKKKTEVQMAAEQEAHVLKYLGIGEGRAKTPPDAKAAMRALRAQIEGLRSGSAVDEKAYAATIERAVAAADGCRNGDVQSSNLLVAGANLARTAFAEAVGRPIQSADDLHPVQERAAAERGGPTRDDEMREIAESHEQGFISRTERDVKTAAVNMRYNARAAANPIPSHGAGIVRSRDGDGYVDMDVNTGGIEALDGMLNVRATLEPDDPEWELVRAEHFSEVKVDDSWPVPLHGASVARVRDAGGFLDLDLRTGSIEALDSTLGIRATLEPGDHDYERVRSARFPDVPVTWEVAPAAAVPVRPPVPSREAPRGPSAQPVTTAKKESRPMDQPQPKSGKVIKIMLGNVDVDRPEDIPKDQAVFYCGRTNGVAQRFGAKHLSALGNEFIVGRDGAQGECAQRFKEKIPTNLAEKPGFKDALNEIAQAAIRSESGKVRLMCHCHPGPCHCGGLAEKVAEGLRKAGYTVQLPQLERQPIQARTVAPARGREAAVAAGRSA